MKKPIADTTERVRETTKEINRAHAREIKDETKRPEPKIGQVTMGFDSDELGPTKSESLIEEISAVVGKNTVDVHGAKYLDAFEVLGMDRVRMALGDVKIAIREGYANDPAAMFYAEITKLMAERGPSGSAMGFDPEPSPYSLSLSELFRELTKTNINVPQIEESGQMVRPYREGNIPWVVYMGPEYFTLSTNKKKSDQVTTTIRTQEGNFDVRLVRGKASPDHEEEGILTVLHERVLGALKKMWADSGCKHTAGQVQLCYVQIHLRRLAEELGWKSFGGRDQKRLKRLLSDLRRISYYLDFRGVPGLEGFSKAYQGFEFLLSANGTGLKKQATSIDLVDVIFSQTLSRQLLARHAVIRPNYLLTVKNEISIQLMQYIEPILRSRLKDPDKRYGTFSISLSSLIEKLSLPAAKWHGIKAERKRQFERAIAELDGRESSNGYRFKFEITEGLFKDDHLLLARLIEVEN